MTDDAPSPWQGALDRRDLIEENAPVDPLALFDDWYGLAQQAAMVEPTAMTLATVDASGRPSARIVLLKGFDADGFRFYTNYLSRKGEALAAHPQAALVFWWESLERQIRIEGRVHKLDASASDAYFARRSRGSRLGAHASPQSRVIADRAELEQRVVDAEARFAEQEVPRPEHWGGYALVPDMFEFWQARRSRLHDRLRYQRSGENWQIDRLSP
ncbi:Pyridoxine-pyridoxamine 5'-phosphate oxidase protein [Salinisphaera shabanensis E1L3A]|uniref:Pyridoxine/pyridoxamine 5'-phosphate oxidase n=1 Tax=Salinisphaera shabanensis E1L3A TaxID=1033802 RepID=U2ELF1_9GAMM|nr:pyridoxamine 5'-phosphate oxidase [Salinisphaera shabanensis]ERJ18760.1 Pyridoxine-pyridoxamine 5'-phosphate oxidase protein [Salinisphaera shabanensis E1L3A]